MKFSDITGHEELKDQLKALADNGRMPHALLLEGPPGIGKFMLARALAQYIHCTDHSSGDSCGKCPACIQHQTFNHIDTHYSFPVLKMKNRSSNPVSDDWIEKWREFLNESPYMDFALWQDMLGNPNGQPVMYVDESASLIRKLSYTSHSGNYMVVVMWLPERMNEECANKLLKLIEEPHSDTVFILVSNEPAKILPTIYSRLRRMEVKRLSDRMVSDYLQHNYSVDGEMAHQVAHLSEGSILGATRRLASSGSDAKMLDLFVTLMRSAYQRDIRALKKWADDVAALGREKAAGFLNYCERLTGENYIFNLRRPDLVYLDVAEARFSTNFARFINERNVEQLRSLMIDARRDILGNANAKIVMMDVAIRVILLLKK